MRRIQIKIKMTQDNKISFNSVCGWDSKDKREYKLNKE